MTLLVFPKSDAWVRILRFQRGEELAAGSENGIRWVGGNDTENDTHFARAFCGDLDMFGRNDAELGYRLVIDIEHVTAIEGDVFPFIVGFGGVLEEAVPRFTECVGCGFCGSNFVVVDKESRW
jgi:hypothetical protein